LKYVSRWVLAACGWTAACGASGAAHRVVVVVVDPAKPVNKRAGGFYPNRYFDDAYTVLT
jgi:hypothetical protein